MGDLNKQTVERLKAPATGTAIAWDREVPGFGVRVTAAGVKSFFLDYRIAGRQRRYTIGRYGDETVDSARKKAGKLRCDISEGIDPLTEKAKLRNEPLMDELTQAYLGSPQFQKLRPGTQVNYRSIIERTIVPKFGNWRVPAISRQDIEKLHFDMRETPYQANRTLAMLSVLFNFAKDERGIKVENFVRLIKPHYEVKRKTWLNEEQMKALDDALTDYATIGFSDNGKFPVPPNPNAANALRLMILTGARMGEVLKSEWSEFDLERGFWTKPSHHTKQKEEVNVPLNSAAWELLKGMKPKGAAGPLFPGTKRKLKNGTLVGGETRVSLIKPWTQVCKRAGLAEEYEVQGTRLDKKTGKPRMLKRYKVNVRRHDLRHNFASYLASNGVSMQVIAELLGHTQTATTERYKHLSEKSKRDGANVFAEVIPFRKAG